MNLTDISIGRSFRLLLSFCLLVVLAVGCGEDKSGDEGIADVTQEEGANRARFEGKGYTEQQITDLIDIEKAVRLHEKVFLFLLLPIGVGFRLGDRTPKHNGCSPLPTGNIVGPTFNAAA